MRNVKKHTGSMESDVGEVRHSSRDRSIHRHGLSLLYQFQLPVPSFLPPPALGGPFCFEARPHECSGRCDGFEVFLVPRRHVAWDSCTAWLRIALYGRDQPSVTRRR